jgi:hypothetical protein
MRRNPRIDHLARLVDNLLDGLAAHGRPAPTAPQIRAPCGSSSTAAAAAVPTGGRAPTGSRTVPSRPDCPIPRPYPPLPTAPDRSAQPMGGRVSSRGRLLTRPPASPLPPFHGCDLR